MNSVRVPELLKTLSFEDVLAKASITNLTLALKVLLLGSCLVLLFVIVNVTTQNIFASTAVIDELRNSVRAAREGLNNAAKSKTGSRNYKSLASSTMFGSLADPGAANQPATKPVTALALSLIGTFMTDGQQPYAIIEDKKKSEQDVFNVGDAVFGEAKLSKILVDRVEIDRNGQIEVLLIDDSPGAASTDSGGVTASGETDFSISEAELDQALENLPVLLTQARAVPYFREGKAIGLRMFAIKSGSLFQKIGLLNGDILKTINDSSLSDITQAMKIFERLKQERSLTLTLERNKEEKQFRYQIR